ncbi:MAG TPA: serine/threonine protein kinase [Pirellulaceae bacterium]|nr:serine/threonine protein kinase [Pirellulaceae bacterium]
MNIDRTQHQSTDEEQQARELSLKTTRPPVDVPGYDAQRLLGRGAYGEVWCGVDQNTGRQVAIKFFAHRSGVDWTLLSREVEKLVYLSADRYVVQLLDVGWDAEPPYYVMEFIENGSLDDLLRQHGPLPVGEAAEIFSEVAIGLMHAHGKGVLHCDLKPANILLDQDNKPRLADFGQSRLSHEQSPSLGTLFYMAPEQADLTAMPDAQWDVYALGAILFCMLTGSPPYRSETHVKGIEAAHDLETRLARYKSAIFTAPVPTEHRRVPRIDGRLIEIIDRCLAVSPERRFPNVQAVIDALDARSLAKVVRPLMFLGFVGPLLLFIVMALFGLRGYEGAVRESAEFITHRARESNDFAAKFAASSIEGEIRRYFRVARSEAERAELHELCAAVSESDIVQQLNRPTASSKDVEILRKTFVADSRQQQLRDYFRQRVDSYLQRLDDEPSELKLASMFVVDNTGRMLAGAYDDPTTINRSAGWNYSFRTYFHGGAADLSDGNREWQDKGPRDVRPITDTHLSAAFQSTTTDIWKVAVSTPIFKDNDPKGELLGVLAMTVNLGDFAYLRTNYHPDRFAVLIDGRPGPNYGVILQHPLFDQLATTRSGDSSHFRIDMKQLSQIQTDTNYRYRDPVAEAAGGQAFRGDWIPATEWVRLPDGPEDRQQMIVLVQERYTKAIEPVQNLGSQLKREGIWALVGVISVVLVLWYVVVRVLSEPRLMARRGVPAHEGSSSTPVQNQTTLTAPRQRS